MTIFPNGLTVKTDVGNVALPTCSKTTSGASPSTRRTALAKSRVTANRAFSSSGVSPPRRIIPAKSVRSMNPRAPSCSTSAPFSGEETTPTHSAPAAAQSCVANTPRPPAAPPIGAGLRPNPAGPPRRAPDQHAMAGLEPHAVDQHAVRGEVRQPVRGRFVPRQVRGLGQQLLRLHLGELGERAPARLVAPDPLRW